MTRLVLIRHGESNATVERRIGGPRTCTGLSPLGRQQAAALADRLASTLELQVDRLISSEYLRARETAALLAPVLGVAVEVDAGFGEHQPGEECDGLSFDDFVDRYGTPDWDTNPYAVTFPGGETIADFQHRVGTALHRVVGANDGATIAIVCHGGVIDRTLRLLLHAPPTGQFQLYSLNTGLTEFKLVRPGLWRLLRYNDAAHLAGLSAETPRD
jgi:2,3-bisphosphoglycerate-dependent phosphoglycerate mutase